MNILYLGHYREDSALGHSSRRYISALEHVKNIKLSVRPLYLQTKTFGIQGKILENELNKSDYYDAVIQDTMPDYYEYNARFGINICVPKIISRNLRHTGWIEKINMMDEVWVNSYFAEKSLRESGVVKMIKVLPEPFDINIKTQKKLDTDKEFNFYTISSSDDKDSLISLLVAYMTEFDKEDNTRLIIKTNGDDETEIKNLMRNAYRITKKSSEAVNEPIVVVGDVEEHKMHQLLNNCDCYIDVSKGSYTTASCIEALIHKKLCIVTNGTANSSYVTKDNGFLVDSDRENILSACKYSTHNISNIYETWNNPNIQSIKSQMRKAASLSASEKQKKISKIDINIFDNTNFSRYIL